MWPQIKREQGYFHDESTFFAVFSIEGFRQVVFWRPTAFFGLQKAIQLSYFVFFVGLRPFWDFFAFERPPFGLQKAAFWLFSPHSCLRHFARRKKSKSGLLQAKRWPFSGKKIPKRPQAYKNHKVFKLHGLSQAKKSLRPPKKQHVFNLLLKRLQKKLTHHENNPALFLSLVPYCIYAESSTILYIMAKWQFFKKNVVP